MKHSDKEIQDWLSLPLTQKDICPFLVCSCGTPVKRTRRQLIAAQRDTPTATICCSRECNNLRRSMICANCLVSFQRKPSQLTRSKSTNHFCSSSCSTTFNNCHKTHGTKRSKLEVWLETTLVTLYPSIKFIFNDKQTINSELDIYIPSLSLAIEINGIFHYEPIFGEAKLKTTQNNDSRKFQACLERNIELCIINCSSQKSPKQNNLYLTIITNIINTKLESSKGFEPFLN